MVLLPKIVARDTEAQAQMPREAYLYVWAWVSRSA